MSLQSVCESIESQLAILLADQFIEEPTWTGLMNFTNSKFYSFIIKKLNEEIVTKTQNSSITDPSSIQLLEYVWTNVHSKVLRYFHLQFHYLKSTQLENFKKFINEEEDDEDEDEDEDFEDMDISSDDENNKLKKSNKSKNRVNYMTFKKVYSKYTKINRKMIEFYVLITNYILKTFDLTKKINPDFYKFSKLDYPTEEKLKELTSIDDKKTFELISYFLHRICFFQGNLSRYKTLFYLFVLSSSSSILKNEFILDGRASTMVNGAYGNRFIRFETFDKSLEYFDYSIKIFPGFSDPLSHIGMIMNSYGLINNHNLYSILAFFNQSIIPNKNLKIINGDKFEAIYYFIKSINQKKSNPSLSIQDVSRILSSSSNSIEFFTKNYDDFLHNKNKLFIGTSNFDKISKNKMIESAIKNYFLIIFSKIFFYKNNSLFDEITKLKYNSGMKFEKFDNLKQSFFGLIKNVLIISEKNIDILEKVLVILIGGYQFHMELNQTENLNKFLKFIFEFINEIFTLIIIQHQKYHLKFPLTIESSINSLIQNRLSLFLPTIRIILNWIRSSKILINYCHDNVEFISKLAFIINDFYNELINHNPHVGEIKEDVFLHRYSRLKFFKEDVDLIGFKPFNQGFKDFNDEFVKKSSFSNLRKSGILPIEDLTIRKLYKLSNKVKIFDPEDEEFKIERDENLLRIYSVGWLGKRLVFDNNFDIIFDEKENLYVNLENKNIFGSIKAENVSINNEHNNNFRKNKKKFKIKNKKKIIKNETEFDDEREIEVKTFGKVNKEVEAEVESIKEESVEKETVKEDSDDSSEIEEIEESKDKYKTMVDSLLNDDSISFNNLRKSNNQEGFNNVIKSGQSTTNSLYSNNIWSTNSSQILSNLNQTSIQHGPMLASDLENQLLTNKGYVNQVPVSQVPISQLSNQVPVGQVPVGQVPISQVNQVPTHPINNQYPYQGYTPSYNYYYPPGSGQFNPNYYYNHPPPQ